MKYFQILYLNKAPEFKYFIKKFRYVQKINERVSTSLNLPLFSSFENQLRTKIMQKNSNNINEA